MAACATEVDVHVVVDAVVMTGAELVSDDSSFVFDAVHEVLFAKERERAEDGALVEAVGLRFEFHETNRSAGLAEHAKNRNAIGRGADAVLGEESLVFGVHEGVLLQLGCTNGVLPLLSRNKSKAICAIKKDTASADVMSMGTITIIRRTESEAA